jgi:hypothetical protein
MIPSNDDLKAGFIVIGILLLASGILAQKADAPKPPDTCTVAAFNSGDKICELSILRMRSKLDDVKFAAATYQQALQALSAEAENAKRDNKWPENVQFDMGNAKFVAPPEPIKKPETKK